MCQIGGTYDSVTLSVGTDRSLAQLDVGLYDCVERTLSVDVTTLQPVGSGYWQLVVYQAISPRNQQCTSAKDVISAE